MDSLWAFLVGGAICALGQILMDSTTLTAPRILVMFVVSGVVLEAAGFYEPLVKLAGTGATVPLPGFGYALCKGAMEAAENGFAAVLGGALKASSAGITAAIVFGYLISMIFSPKSPKR